MPVDHDGAILVFWTTRIVNHLTSKSVLFLVSREQLRMMDALYTRRFPYGTIHGRNERSREVDEYQLALDY